MKTLHRNFCLLICLFSFSARAAALDLTAVSEKLADALGFSSSEFEGSSIFRSLNISSGGRAEGMGTAFSGVCDDISFFDCNPAGSAVLENTEIALFHNSWIADSAVETLCGTFRKNNFGMGFQAKSFYVPFSEYNLFGEKVASDYYSETSIAFNASYNFFSGYDFKGLALGANIRASFLKMPSYTDNKTDQIISGSGIAQSALGIMTDFGALVRFNFLKFFNSTEPNCAFALVFSNWGAGISGFTSKIRADELLPSKISAGFSVRFIKPFLFSFEVRQPVNIFSIKESESLSLAAGIESAFTDFFSVQCGILVQGGNPRISLGSQFDVKGIKMNVCYTLDLTTSMNPVNHISLAAKMNLGDRGRGKIKSGIQKKYAEGLSLFAKGGKTEIIRAIEIWKEAEALASSIGINFQPATRAIETAEEILSIHTRLTDFGTLD